MSSNTNEKKRVRAVNLSENEVKDGVTKRKLTIEEFLEKQENGKEAQDIKDGISKMKDELNLMLAYETYLLNPETTKLIGANGTQLEKLYYGDSKISLRSKIEDKVDKIEGQQKKLNMLPHKDLQTKMAEQLGLTAWNDDAWQTHFWAGHLDKKD